MDQGTSFPIKTSNMYLRGGSNAIPLFQNDLRYYITGCHSRLHIKDRFYHYSHLVIVDTESWEIIYLSKALRYHYNGENVGF